MNILKNNLDNINTDINLWGEEIKKLKLADRIGFCPISIWIPDWNIVKKLKKIIGDKGETRKTLNSAYGYMPGTSIFNPHLAQMILSAYCPYNAKIFDPFGGGGTRGFIAVAMGHNYTGIEIREEEVDRIIKQQKKLNVFFEIICCDCRIYPIKDNTYNFSYTCPPYYNLEIYSRLDGDMSNANSYHDFLEMIKDALIVNYRALQPGALAVWVVGNFRNNNHSLVHYNGDLIRLAQSIGFQLWDELIFWRASGNAVCRSSQFSANRKSVRVHEYILILKKPA